MINERDLYCFVIQNPLTVSDQPSYGFTFARYEVRQQTIVYGLSRFRCYVVTCTQRIVIPNRTQFDLVPADPVKQFLDYPASLKHTIVLTVPGNPPLRVLNYSPRTVNATISASASQGAGSSTTQTRQHTSGSSTSDTNTFGFSFSEMAGFGGDYTHSSTSEQSSSTTTGGDSGSSAQSSESDAMTVKDWASYGFLNADNTTPTWIWAQEYPWDTVQFRGPPGVPWMPDYVSQRLFESSSQFDIDDMVLPPSQLSLFGIDFNMKASWLLILPPTLEDQIAQLSYATEYATASHGYKIAPPPGAPVSQFAGLNAPVSFAPLSPTTLDLTTLGLDPIRNGSARNGAVIGFLPSKFVTAVPAAGSKFKILSDANTLQVTGKGFDSPMLTTFANGAVTLTVQFKIIDTRTDYALFMKHWTTTDRGCTLEFVFNGNDKVIRHIDSNEGEGGEENLSSIVMRNKDYTTIDYHDYLVMGLNTVGITITPDEGSGPAGYILRALAIGVQ